MKVFITGGTGYVGSVLVEQLVAAGHEVNALARSDASSRALIKAGALPIRGELADAALLRSHASVSDAVIHAAVDYSMSVDSQAVELTAVAALAAGLGEPDVARPFIYTSTGLVYGFGTERNTDENAVLPQVSAQPVKVSGERAVLETSGITPIVVRAGLVYGRGGSGLVTGLIDSARRSGAATYIEEGANEWSPVHVDDLAALYLAALANPIAGVYNAAGDSPFTFRELADAIAELTGARSVSVPFEAAQQQLGPFAEVLRSGGSLSAAKARSSFGWRPSGIPLLEDVRAGSYRGHAAAA